MPAQDFETSTSRVAEGPTVVTARGELDIATVHRLREPLLDAIGDGRGSVVVDLTDVRFFASIGIEVLLVAHERTRTGGGELRIVTPRLVRRTLTSVGLGDVLELHDTLEEALG
ncbi:STAS domain-containing protein [Saccharothrix syringae]|uniref:Anti-sigma factor antagonist n=1 Tax=Saccharothrix syringae TaxID=103733 RepID=A0A5Q0GW26_SACSY|nr:STAS domain-containing protein [Saccharothrix syringae]QFZ18267.1 anti-sigma factor antagonist [Saccharothrix syringae]